MKNLTAKDITPDCKQAVAAYLLARTLFEVERERVDKIQQAILDAGVYNVEDRWADKGRTVERITKLKDTFLMSDEDHHDYLTFVRQELVKAGYVIKDCEGEPFYSYCCPALSAESLKRDAEHVIIDSFAGVLKAGDDFGHKLLCNGLDKYYKFVDLCVGLVVNLPDFQNPLTGKAVKA